MNRRENQAQPYLDRQYYKSTVRCVASAGDCGLPKPFEDVERERGQSSLRNPGILLSAQYG